MKIVDKKITLAELKQMSKNMFDGLVKAVVDIKRNVLAVDAQMHADEEKELLENGSKQEDLWGINLYPEKFGSHDFVEFDSMINLRPWQNNRSRGVDDRKIQQSIITIVTDKIVK